MTALPRPDLLFGAFEPAAGESTAEGKCFSLTLELGEFGVKDGRVGAGAKEVPVPRDGSFAEGRTAQGLGWGGEEEAEGRAGTAFGLEQAGGADRASDRADGFAMDEVERFEDGDDAGPQEARVSKGGKRLTYVADWNGWEGEMSAVPASSRCFRCLAFMRDTAFHAAWASAASGVPGEVRWRFAACIRIPVSTMSGKVRGCSVRTCRTSEYAAGKLGATYLGSFHVRTLFHCMCLSTWATGRPA